MKNLTLSAFTFLFFLTGHSYADDDCVKKNAVAGQILSQDSSDSLKAVFSDGYVQLLGKPVTLKESDHQTYPKSMTLNGEMQGSKNICKKLNLSYSNGSETVERDIYILNSGEFVWASDKDNKFYEIKSIKPTSECASLKVDSINLGRPVSKIKSIDSESGKELSIDDDDGFATLALIAQGIGNTVKPNDKTVRGLESYKVAIKDSLALFKEYTSGMTNAYDKEQYEEQIKNITPYFEKISKTGSISVDELQKLKEEIAKGFKKHFYGGDTMQDILISKKSTNLSCFYKVDTSALKVEGRNHNAEKEASAKGNEH